MLLSEAWNSYKSANDTTPEKQRKKKTLCSQQVKMQLKKKKYHGNNTDILNLKLVGKRNLYPSCVLDKKNLAFNIYIFTFT